MRENEGLRLRTLGSPSSTAQEVPARHKHQFNLALYWDLLASRKHWKLYHEQTEMNMNTTTHRLLFWSGPIWHQINKVQCFLFFAVTITKPARLWLSAKLYSTLGELYTAIYRPSGRPGIHQPECSRVTCAVHKNNYINSTSCPFCSPEKCGSWGWWRATLCIWEREKRLCCHGVQLLFHKCFSKVMPCLINSKSSHSSTATQTAYSRCSLKPFHADL